MIDPEDYAKKVSQADLEPGEVAAAMAGIGFFPLHEISRLFGSANGAEVIDVNGRKFYRRPAEEEILARSLTAVGFSHESKSLFKRGDIDVKIIFWRQDSDFVFRPRRHRTSVCGQPNSDSNKKRRLLIAGPAFFFEKLSEFPCNRLHGPHLGALGFRNSDRVQSLLFRVVGGIAKIVQPVNDASVFEFYCINVGIV